MTSNTLRVLRYIVQGGKQQKGSVGLTPKQTKRVKQKENKTKTSKNS